MTTTDTRAAVLRGTTRPRHKINRGYSGITKQFWARCVCRDFEFDAATSAEVSLACAAHRNEWAGEDGHDDLVVETLTDCITSFFRDGTRARDAAEFILSESSGLTVNIA